jgi:hypothetical protein
MNLDKSKEMTMKKLTAVLAATLGAAAVLAPVADASVTEHLYQVGGPTHFYDKAGKRININPPATLPSAGDYFVERDKDLRGTLAHHTSTGSGTDTLRCTFSNPDTAKCSLTIKVGGSTLSFDGFAIHFNRHTPVHARLTRATGKHAGARGSVTITGGANQNDELTVKLS